MITNNYIQFTFLPTMPLVRLSSASPIKVYCSGDVLLTGVVGVGNGSVTSARLPFSIQISQNIHYNDNYM